MPQFEAELNNKAFRDLVKAIKGLKSDDEAKRFLRDVCTLSEVKAMSERLQVARGVGDGIPYRKISENTGASTATITRVAHWYHHGMGGYKLVLDRLKK